MIRYTVLHRQYIDILQTESIGMFHRAWGIYRLDLHTIRHWFMRRRSSIRHVLICYWPSLNSLSVLSISSTAYAAIWINLCNYSHRADIALIRRAMSCFTLHYLCEQFNVNFQNPLYLVRIQNEKRKVGLCLWYLCLIIVNNDWFAIWKSQPDDYYRFWFGLTSNPLILSSLANWEHQNVLHWIVIVAHI